VFDGQSGWRPRVVRAKGSGGARANKEKRLHKGTFRKGSLASVGRYSHGKKSGPWKYYLRNGLLRAAGKYVDGQLDGLWTWYREGGGLLQVGRFKDGKQVGLWKRYHASGGLCDIGRYVAGKKTGEWKYYDKHGKLRRTEQHTRRMQPAKDAQAGAASRRTTRCS
jgi:antitoxin component YwqK of YwqJK toxin-antitoxin module